MRNHEFQTTLGEIASFRRGVSYKGSDLAESELDGTLMINLKSFTQDGKYRPDGIKFHNGNFREKSFIKPNEIVICNTCQTRGGELLGASVMIPYAFHKKKVVGSHHTTILTVTSDNVLPEYLVHVLNSPIIRMKIKQYKRGALIQGILTDDLKKLVIQIPSVDEQEKFVSILDKVHEIEHASEQIPQQVEVILRSEFNRRFGDPVLNQNSWDEVTLESLLETIIDYRGKTPPKSDSGIPLLSAANITNHKIDLSHEQYISQEDYEKWTIRGFTHPGDVLITTEAPVGQVALYPDEGVYQISRRMMALRPDCNRINSVFLYFVLSHPNWQRRLTRILRGSTVPRVLKPDLIDQNGRLKQENGAFLNLFLGASIILVSSPLFVLGTFPQAFIAWWLGDRTDEGIDARTTYHLLAAMFSLPIFWPLFSIIWTLLAINVVGIDAIYAPIIFAILLPAFYIATLTTAYGYDLTQDFLRNRRRMKLSRKDDSVKLHNSIILVDKHLVDLI